MLVPNRHKSATSYRYGFQGQEKDDEIRGGEGNSLNYTFRMHDPRIGRFFATDPLSREYPWYSPYVFSGNRVMDMVELEGLEPKKKGFLEGFGESLGRGVINLVNHVINNPNHAGYGNGTLPSTGKPPTVNDFKKYEVNWKEQIDPYWQINNFSSNAVFGVSGFAGGIMDGDGEKTAQATLPLLNAVGVISSVKVLSSVKPLTIIEKIPVSRAIAADVSRINIAKGRTRFTPLRGSSGQPVSAGFNHVLEGHFGKILSGTRSVFTITPDKLKSILQSRTVVNSPVTALEGGQFRRTVNTGVEVGNANLKQGGGVTSWIDVITDKKGNLITTYPVKAPIK